MKSLYFITIIVSLIAISSCSKESKDIIVDFEAIQISTLCTSIEGFDGIKEETIIITSQDEYMARMKCMANAPVIDFSKHFLLGGWVAFSNCASLKEQDVRIKNSTLHYQIDIDQADCQKLDTVYFMVSVPISYEKYKVDFRINY